MLLSELEQDATIFRALRTRTVAQWGYAFDYATFEAKALPNPVPPNTQRLMDRLPGLHHGPSSPAGLVASASADPQQQDSVVAPHFEAPNQCTLNRYRPGDGIPAHADNPQVFGSAIWVLSLEAGINMEFSPLVPDETAAETSAETTSNLPVHVPLAADRLPEKDSEPEPAMADAFGQSNVGKATQGRVRDLSRTCSVWLPPRSLLLLTGASRYDWTHAIAQRKTDLVDGEVRPRSTRTSLTFRWVTNAMPKRDDVV